MRQKSTDRLVDFFASPGIEPSRVPTRKPDGSIHLEFPSERSRKGQMQNCKQKVSQNCFSGGRMACSLNALKRCRPGWLERIFKPVDQREVIACEELYMEECLKQAQEKCSSHSDIFCENMFENQSSSVMKIK